jgi:glycogen synthase
VSTLPASSPSPAATGGPATNGQLISAPAEPHGPVPPRAPSPPPAAGPIFDTIDRPPAHTLLLEVAWEVCNQLGGIYQVIRSKAPRMVRRWHHRYLMVGPFNPVKAALEFEERAPTSTSWLGRVIDELQVGGLTARHGHWLIPGRPRVILLDARLPVEELDALKARLYVDHGIESPAGNDLIDGVLAFAEASRRLVWAITKYWHGTDDDSPASLSHSAGSRVLVHAHEWMAGLGLPMLRHERCPAAMVFTTHATQLGRTCAWNDDHFYDHLPHLNHAHEAERFRVKTQHYAERACAHSSHVFTTVSQITGEECTHLVGRSPDVVTPNGLSIEHFNLGHDFQTVHAQFKERINRFTMGHFFPSGPFDLDKTIYMFTSGRFEPRNKGFDLAIEAMARLNSEIRARKLDRTVVFFIVTQRPTRSLHPQVLGQRAVLAELDSVVERMLDDVRERAFRRAAAGHVVNVDALMGEYWKLRLKRTQHAFKSDRLPMIVTHLLEDDQRDEVLNQIRNVWLFNRPEDPVKIVYHPEFITPTNPLWGIEYEQFVRGCHVGVFPSSYEPWGYTPLECLAMGVPAITSDLAGFGRYVQDTLPDLAGGFAQGASGDGRGGIKILKRRGRSFADAASELAESLLEYCMLDRRERITLRNQVERRSWEFDWNVLGAAYDWAHDLALARAAAEVSGA